MKVLPLIGLAALTLVIITLANRWLGSINPGPTISPIAERYYDLHYEAARINNDLRSLIIQDSIKPLIPKKPELFVAALDHKNEGLDKLRRKAQTEVPAPPKAAVGIVAAPVFYAHLDGIEDYGRMTRVYRGNQDGVNYCVRSITAHDSRMPGKEPHRYYEGEDRENILGHCGFYGRYGAPGRLVDSWLRTDNSRWSYYDPSEWYDENYEFGSTRLTRLFAMSLNSRACAAGRRDKCTEAFIGVPVAGPLNRFTPDMWGAGILPSQPSTLRALETRFGADRFAQFWRSNADVQTSFADAFGMSVGEWVYSWTDRYRDRVHATPRMNLQTILLSMAIVALLVALTASRSNRRVI